MSVTTSKVFITGASTGLGEGLARHYARPGAVLGLVARRANLLESLRVELQKQGAAVHFYAGDVSDTAWMAQSARAFLEAAGGADLVIANAGIGIPDVTREGDSEQIAKLLRINLIGVTNTVIPFVPSMIARGSGVLSAVSSVLGWGAVPGRAAYCSSKAGIIAFMDGLRMDLEGTGVHAMTFCPGYVKTPMTAQYAKMPFVIDVGQAVQIMTRAVEGRTRTITFPWQMWWVSTLLAHAPEWLKRHIGPPPRAD